MKPIRTCLSIDCPERRSVCCRALPRTVSGEEGTGHFECSNCRKEFIGGECTSGNEDYLERELIEEFIKRTNKKYGVDTDAPTKEGWKKRFREKYTIFHGDFGVRVVSIEELKKGKSSFECSVDILDFIEQEKALSKEEGKREVFYTVCPKCLLGIDPNQIDEHVEHCTYIKFPNQVLEQNKNE